MPTYSDEVNIYNPDAIQNGINEARDYYVTSVTNDGIWVTPHDAKPVNGAATSTTRGWHIADALEYFRGTVRYIKAWLNGSTPTVRLGQDSSGHADVTPSGLEVFTDLSTSVASFGATSRIGKPYVSGATDNESYMELTHQGFELHDDSDDVYFDVKDMRDRDYDGDFRAFVMTETFTAEYENQRAYSMTFEPLEIYQLQIDEGTVYYPSTRDFSTFGNMVEFGTTNVTLPQSLSIAEGSSVKFTYPTADERSKCITFGTRASGSITGPMSCAFGDEVEASGPWSSAFGRLVSSTGATSHAEGYYTIASNTGSHAEGFGSRAGGYFSHAEGNSGASGEYSHSQNLGTLAAKDAQTVIGTYNVEDTSQMTTHPSLINNYGKYALIVGNGTSTNARSNALAVDWDGSIYSQAMAGVIQMFAGSTPPSGWLVCDGSAVSRTTYATLFAAIGTTWGTGDGSTTFNLPDLRGRAPIGAGTGSGLTARTLGSTGGSEALQSHDHNAASNGYNVPGKSGGWNWRTTSSGSNSNYNNTPMGGSTAAIASITKTGSAGSGNAGNMQPFAVINFIICTGKTS